MKPGTINAFLSSPLGIGCFVVASIAFWWMVCFLISLITGWSALSRRFRAQSEPYGDTKTAGPFLYTIYMRYWTHYSGVIRLIAATESLYATVLFPFRPGHPPLCIPWNEIQFGRTRRIFFPYIVLTLGDRERIPLRIAPRMAGTLGILDRVPV